MLKDTIRSEFMNARKTGDTLRKNALEAVVALILQKEKTEAGKEVSDAEVIDCISKEVKVQREIMEMYESKDGEKSKEAKGKVDILVSYLPKQLTDDEVLQIIRKADVYDDASAKTKGMIIKTIMPTLQGKFDKSKVNSLVERYLSGKLLK